MKIKRLFFIFIIILTMSCNVVNADPTFKTQKVVKTDITVQAKVPDDFDRIIYVNFVAEDGTNSEYTLNKENKYKIEGKIKVGKQKINFIKISNNEDNKYEYSYSSEYLDQEEGKMTLFEVTVALNRNYVPKKDEKIQVEEKEQGTINKENKGNLKENNQYITHERDKKIEEKNELIKMDSIKGLLIDGAVVLILSIIYLIIKRKQEKGDM